MNDTYSLAQVKWKGNTISHFHHVSESHTGKADVTAPVRHIWRRNSQCAESEFDAGRNFAIVLRRKSFGLDLYAILILSLSC